MLKRPSDIEIYSNDEFSQELSTTVIEDITPSSDTNNGEDVEEEFQEDYNYIPEKLYPELPSILQEATNIFLDRREKDIFLTGALSVLGGCFHNVRAYNSVDGISFAPNLFVFIIAPPASGKQALTYAKKPALEVAKSFKGNLGRIMFLPGNSSSAAILKHLQENSGVGVMLESEIDIIANAKKQEWGDYTDVIRVAFENGSYSYSRKNSHHEIEEVKFSMALSGTPNQFKTFMVSSENGLFSRGCYYAFDDKKNEYTPYGRMNSETSINEQFEKIALEVKSYYERLTIHPEVKIVFSNDQLEKIKTVFEKEVDEVQDADLRRNINRVFTIVLKIATILTVLKINEGDIEYLAEIPCDDTMLPIAIELGKTYLMHSYEAHELLTARNDLHSVNELKVLNKLPNEFIRMDAIVCCKELNISERTIDGILKKLVKKNELSLVSHGKYKRINEKKSR